jgi:hypothetical protein
VRKDITGFSDCRYDTSANQKQLLLPRTQFDDGPAMIAEIAASDRVRAASPRAASSCVRHCT